MIWMARSSSDQCEKDSPRSAGFVVASTRTLCRSSGGKSARGPAARQVDQTVETAGREALPPFADGAGVAAEFAGDLPVGGAVGLPAAKDKATAERLCLWRGVGVGRLGELLFFVAGETDKGCASGHEARSLCGRFDP